MKSNQPLIISILLHACIYLLALLTPDQGLMRAPPQPIEVVYRNETKSRQIVADPTQERLFESLKKLESQADRLSRLTQRVKQETVASRSGPTQNSQPSPTEQNTQSNAVNSLAKTDLQQTQKDETGPSISKPMTTGQVGRNANTGDSSIAEYIPDVRQGGFTALNTDQFVHYTFYARINEQLRNRWIENVRDFLNRTPQSEVNRLALKTQQSQVEVLLDAKGNFVKALLHRRAENGELDESVISAFRLAAPMHNPPSEMVEADGFVHLHYGFFVQFRPRYLASGSK